MLYYLFITQNIFGIQTDSISIQQIIWAFVLAILISLVSYKFNFLKFSGMLTVFVMAFIIFSLGGWKWTLPMVTFFILSNLISKYKKLIIPGDDLSEKSERRDTTQVLANGGFATLLLIANFFITSELLYLAYVSSIAVVCADTWETEIGTLIKGNTFDILRFNLVQPGISGGISAAGTMGGLAGAFTVAISSLYWINKNHFLFTLVVAATGIIGSVIDSIIGAAFQRKNICLKCRSVTEKSVHCQTSTQIFSGISWLNNDAVNFAAASFGGIFSILITELIFI